MGSPAYEGKQLWNMVAGWPASGTGIAQLLDMAIDARALAMKAYQFEE